MKPCVVRNYLICNKPIKIAPINLPANHSANIGVMCVAFNFLGCVVTAFSANILLK